MEHDVETVKGVGMSSDGTSRRRRKRARIGMKMFAERSCRENLDGGGIWVSGVCSRINLKISTMNTRRTSTEG